MLRRVNQLVYNVSVVCVSADNVIAVDIQSGVKKWCCDVNHIDIANASCYPMHTGVDMISEERLYAGLGQRIRSFREGKNGAGRMTQAELAQLVGLERTSITNIEKGTQKVPLHVLYRMCEIFKIDISAALPSVEEVLEDSQDEWLPVVDELKLPP